MIKFRKGEVVRVKETFTNKAYAGKIVRIILCYDGYYQVCLNKGNKEKILIVDYYLKSLTSGMEWTQEKI